VRRIGLLSDTHGQMNQRVLKFLSDTDEIWHAGDIGDYGIYEKLSSLKPLKAVHGNIDGQDIRSECPEFIVFKVEDVKVVMLHIGGSPGRYDRRAGALILKERPNLFVSGHSHILKVMYDQKFDLLHINPGAAGSFGFHTSVTAVRFTIDGKNIKDLEVLDIPRK
jgi:putative phosphoesterase